MSKYKFLKSHTSTTKVWDPSIGTSSAVVQSVTFNVGDIVDGNFVPAHQGGGGVMAPFQVPDSIIVPNPMTGKGLFNGNGAANSFNIPPNKLQLVSGSATINESIKKFFTSINIIIGLVFFTIIVGIVGILKLAKVF